jgi:hypothetical protein
LTRELFSSESTHNARFSTGRLRGIRGALIASGRRQSAKKRPIAAKLDARRDAGEALDRSNLQDLVKAFA